jgi:hypothetical protein
VPPPFEIVGVVRVGDSGSKQLLGELGEDRVPDHLLDLRSGLSCRLTRRIQEMRQSFGKVQLGEHESPPQNGPRRHQELHVEIPVLAESIDQRMGIAPAPT